MDMLRQFAITQNGWKPESHFFPNRMVLLLILATTVHSVEFLIEMSAQSLA
jgi:hypothetical protein